MKARALILFVLLLAPGAWRLLRTPTVASAAEEQAVIVTIKLNSGDMGSTEERQRITVLEDQLSDVIKRSATGEFDGDEYGGGVCTIYMYGPRAATVRCGIARAEEVPRSERFVCRKALREARSQTGPHFVKR
jgi:hypothetical protein